MHCVLANVKTLFVYNFKMFGHNYCASSFIFFSLYPKLHEINFKIKNKKFVSFVVPMKMKEFLAVLDKVKEFE